MKPLGFLRRSFEHGVHPAHHKGQTEDLAIQRVPFGTAGPWVFGGLGFAATLLSVVLAFIPPEGSADPALFMIKVGGGCLAFIGAGLVFYFVNRPRKTG